MTDAFTILAIKELQTTIHEQRRHFNRLVEQKKMTPYTRDSRLLVLEKILKMYYTAANTQQTITTQLNNQP